MENRFLIRATTVQGAASFLPDRLIMLDCEMTGLRPEVDDIIQVAALKLARNDFQYQAEGPVLNIFIHTDKQPTSAFELEHLVEVYQQANKSPYGYAEAHDILKQWLGDWWGEVTPTGDCVPTDILFLREKGVITSSYYDGDVPVPGTFHYEYFDANAIKLIARTKMGFKFDKDLPMLKGQHDARVDCYNQLTELNAFLEVLLS